ncbi:MAG: hypothetical protein PHN56_02235 [Candidatus Nanoarchaeia archaeon]|nr:hypothetical protein [Candidatus Nanoarchaeia archaeon]
MTNTAKYIKSCTQMLIDKIEEKGLNLEKMKLKHFLNHGFYSNQEDEKSLICIEYKGLFETYLSLFYMNDNHNIPLEINFSENKKYFEISIDTDLNLPGYERIKLDESLKIFLGDYSSKLFKRIHSLDFKKVKIELEGILKNLQ